MIILWMILILIVLFLAVLIIRALSFRPTDEYKPSGETVTLDSNKITKDMVEMIRCKTISYNDSALIISHFPARRKSTVPPARRLSIYLKSGASGLQ